MRPEDLKYTEEHQWVHIEENEVTIGVTDFAASELGDIVYLELPEAGRRVNVGDSMGTIETVKAVEELYAPVSGVVIASNESLGDKPELVNEDPFGDGWMVRIELESVDEDRLISAADYNSRVDGD